MARLDDDSAMPHVLARRGRSAAAPRRRHARESRGGCTAYSFGSTRQVDPVGVLLVEPPRRRRARHAAAHDDHRFRAPPPSTAAPPLARSRLLAPAGPSERRRVSPRTPRARGPAAASEASRASAPPPGMNAARNWSSADAQASSSAADPGTRKGKSERHALGRRRCRGAVDAADLRRRRPHRRDDSIVSPEGAMHRRVKRPRRSTSSSTASIVSALAASPSAAPPPPRRHEELGRLDLGRHRRRRSRRRRRRRRRRCRRRRRGRRGQDVLEARRVPSRDGRTFDLPSCSAHDHSRRRGRRSSGRRRLARRPPVTTVLSSASVAPRARGRSRRPRPPSAGTCRRRPFVGTRC